MINFKKLTCMILASAMIITAAPQNALADEIQPGETVRKLTD